MKKTLVAALGFLMVLGLASCGPENPQPVAHECKHVCETCGGCLDKTCADPVCATKCICQSQGGGEVGFTDAIKDAYKTQIAEGKFVLTCCGFEGMSTVQDVIEELGYEAIDSKTVGTAQAGKFTCNKLINLDTIPEGYVCFVAVGYTGKSLVGTSLDGEKQRAKDIAALKNKGIKVVVVEIAGKPNCGENADILLGDVLKGAETVIAKSNTDTGSYFTNLKDTYPNMEVEIPTSVAEVNAAFKFIGFEEL